MGGWRRPHRGAAPPRRRRRRHGRLDAGAGAGQGATRCCRRRVDSLDELLADPGLDAVHITSPNHVHAAQAAAAIAAGKHVVCEKPLGVDGDRDRRARRPRRRRRRRQRGVLQPPLLPAEPARRRPRRRRRDRRAAVRHRPLPPGLAAARHRLELAPRRRPPGQPARRRRHRLALARPRAVRHRPAGRRGVRRPAHVRPRAQPPGRRGRDVRRRPRRRRRAAGARARWRATTPPACCCASTAAAAACARSARCRPAASNTPGVGDRRRRVGAGVGSEDPEQLWIGHRGRPNEVVEKDPALHDAGRRRGGRLSRRPRRGLSRHVPRPVHRRVRRRRRRCGRRAVAGLPDVRRRARRDGRVRARSPHRRAAGSWTKVDRRT